MDSKTTNNLSQQMNDSFPLFSDSQVELEKLEGLIQMCPFSMEENSFFENFLKNMKEESSPSHESQPVAPQNNTTKRKKHYSTRESEKQRRDRMKCKYDELRQVIPITRTVHMNFPCKPIDKLTKEELLTVTKFAMMDLLAENQDLKTRLKRIKL